MPCRICTKILSLRSMAVLSSRAQERRSSEIRTRSARERAAKPQVASAPISSRFLCPRPPLLLSAPNQNRHATQARKFSPYKSGSQSLIKLFDLITVITSQDLPGILSTRARSWMLSQRKLLEMSKFVAYFLHLLILTAYAEGRFLNINLISKNSWMKLSCALMIESLRRKTLNWSLRQEDWEKNILYMQENSNGKRTVKYKPSKLVTQKTLW